MVKCVEELAECQQAICKVILGGENFDNMAEEIADAIHYHLRIIEEQTGRNPRNFYDLCWLVGIAANIVCAFL